jgi:hypothetical protein
LLVALTLLAVLLSPPSLLAQASDPDRSPRLEIELEGGPVWQTRNEVRIPNEGGTKFSVVDLIGNGPSAAFRLETTYNINRRHGLRLVLAPLSISGTGTLNETVEFAGATFAAGIPTEARYRFNSYRLTYRYRFHDGPKWRWHIGFTAKVRDAKVALEQEGASASDSNVGPVPLIHLAGQVRLSPHWRISGDLDALAAPQGRAEDLALKVRYDPSERWSLALGYRTLEGGADADTVYTFAWLHYLVASVALRL